MNLASCGEWDERREQDWGLRKYPIHDAFYRFMRELQQLYLSHPELAGGLPAGGFSMAGLPPGGAVPLCPGTAGNREKRLAAVFNFSSQRQEKYELDIPWRRPPDPCCPHRLGALRRQHPRRPNQPFPKKAWKFRFSLPPFSGMLLKIEPHEP